MTSTRCLPSRFVSRASAVFLKSLYGVKVCISSVDHLVRWPDAGRPAETHAECPRRAALPTDAQTHSRPAEGATGRRLDPRHVDLGTPSARSVLCDPR